MWPSSPDSAPGGHLSTTNKRWLFAVWERRGWRSTGQDVEVGADAGVTTGDSAESNEPLRSSVSRGGIRSGQWSHQSNVSPALCLTAEPHTPASTDPLNWLSAGPATKASWQQGYFRAEITRVSTGLRREAARARAIALHYRDWKTPRRSAICHFAAESNLLLATAPRNRWGINVLWQQLIRSLSSAGSVSLRVCVCVCVCVHVCHLCLHLECALNREVKCTDESSRRSLCLDIWPHDKLLWSSSSSASHDRIKKQWIKIARRNKEIVSTNRQSRKNTAQIPLVSILYHLYCCCY